MEPSHAPEFLRTPDARFAELPHWPHPPRYFDWQGLRVHYVDVGRGPVVLLVHGEPDWGYMYRDAIATLSAAGLRC
jgi:haloalkane dehalogenase